MKYTFYRGLLAPPAHWICGRAADGTPKPGTCVYGENWCSVMRVWPGVGKGSLLGPGLSMCNAKSWGRCLMREQEVELGLGQLSSLSSRIYTQDSDCDN